MQNSRNVAIKVAMGVLIVLYVIALTASLMKAGPTVDDVKRDLRNTQRELAATREQLDKTNKRLDEVLNELKAERARNDKLQSEQTSGFLGGVSSGSFTLPSSGTSTPPTGAGNSNGGSTGGGSTGGGSSGGGSSNNGQDAGLVDGSLCQLGLLCL